MGGPLGLNNPLATSGTDFQVIRLIRHDMTLQAGHGAPAGALKRKFEKRKMTPEA